MLLLQQVSVTWVDLPMLLLVLDSSSLNSASVVVKYGWMTSCGVHLELLTYMFVSSLLAYIAVKRMPDKNKPLQIKKTIFFLSVFSYIWHYIDPTHGLGGSLSPWGLAFIAAHSLLQPNRGQSRERKEAYLLSPQTHPDSEVVLFCTLKGRYRRRTEGARG